jgi:hypothetical protein
MDNINAEAKVIGAISIFAIIVLVGVVLFLSNQNKVDSSIPQEQIVSSNGLHWHPKLEIYIKGEKQEIPSGVGLAGNIHQEMHTHDEDAKDGIIHMEMNGIVTKDETRLSNFFKIWGKKFTSNQIFEYTNGDEGKVRMLINDAETDMFVNYEMKDGDKIEIRYE